jgi:hypothetical protein
MLGIPEPKGKSEATLELIVCPFGHGASGAEVVEFGDIVFTYDLIDQGVDIVTVDLVTTWRRHRLRLDDLPEDFVNAMRRKATEVHNG